MSNFSGLFPRSLRPSSIHQILNKPNATLEELFDNDEFSFELKNCNPRLMDYFTKSTERIVQLLDFIIKMPPDPNDKNRGYKYPFLACEIFEKDIATIINAVITGMMPKSRESVNTTVSQKTRDSTDDYEIILSENKSPRKSDYKEEYKNKDDYLEDAGENRNSTRKSRASNNSKSAGTILEYLFSFLDSNEELNPVLSGYFNKVVESLFRRNPEKMIEFVYDNEGIMASLAKHIGNRSISDLLGLFICYESFHYEDEKPLYLTLKLEVIEDLVNILTESEDIDSSTNAAHVLCEIVSKSDVIVDGKEIGVKLVSDKVLGQIFNTLRKRDNFLVLNACNVLYFIVEYLNPYRPVRNMSLSYKLQRQSRDVENEPLIDCISKNIATFAQILSNKTSQEGVKTAFGTNVKLLGSGRLRMIELIDRILKMNSRRIIQRVCETNLIQIITELFLEFEWNNMLHHSYERFVTTLLTRNDPGLLKALFIDSQLLEIIMNSMKESKIEIFKQGRKIRKGNLGHITRIANILVDSSQNSAEIKEYLTGNPEWENFVQTILQETNDKNNTQIGGVNMKEMIAHKAEFSPKTGITDELELEGFPFGQISKDNERFGKADEILRPAPGGGTPSANNYNSPAIPTGQGNFSSESFMAVQIQRGVRNASPLQSESLLGQISPSFDVSANSPIIDELGSKNPEDQIKIIRSHSLDQNTESNVFSEFSNIKQPGGLNSSPGKGQTISHKTSKSLFDGQSINIQYLAVNEEDDDDTFDDPNLSDAAKKEKRKLTLGRKSFPASLSISENGDLSQLDQNTSMRSSISGTKVSKKVKIKLKKTDSIDGTKVLEALNKYKGLDGDEQDFPIQSYSVTQSSFRLLPPVSSNFALINDSKNYSNNQLSATEPVSKNFRSKSNS